MNYEIIGIGNALVDIQAQVDEKTLKSLGYAKGLMTLSDPVKQEELLLKLKGHSLTTCSGGSAANTVHGIGALGGKAYYIGRVSDDIYGRHYTEDMANCGVGFPGPGSEVSGTGTSVVLITPDAQRTMVTNLGVSTSLHPDNVDETIVAGSRFVYIEGYLWTGEETKNSALRLTQLAKKSGIPVAFTLSDVFIANSFRKELEEYIKWEVDILFCNEAEAQALAETEDTEQAFSHIQGLCEKLFCTMGKKGAWAGQRGESKVSVKGFAVDAI
ncbi:MAG: adenosine kinase, partial [Nitrospinota bacterium]